MGGAGPPTKRVRACAEQSGRLTVHLLPAPPMVNSSRVFEAGMEEYPAMNPIRLTFICGVIISAIDDICQSFFAGTFAFLVHCQYEKIIAHGD